MGFCYGPDTDSNSAFVFVGSSDSDNRAYRMVFLNKSWRFLIVIGLSLFFSAPVWAGSWSNSPVSNISYDDAGNYSAFSRFWNNALNTATADGSGGIVSVSSGDVIIANEVVPMAMTEASSAAELAAAAAFLPEAALYAIAGAALGNLIWDAANQSYEIAPAYDNTFTCPGGSVLNIGGYSSVGAWYDANNGRNFIGDGSIKTTISGSILIVTVNNQGSPDSFAFPATCPDGSVATGSGTGTDVPPGDLPPYVLPWLQSNPNSAPPLAGKEGDVGHPPQLSSGPTLSGPSSTTLPPVTTTVTNPDGSKSTSTVTQTINWNYSGPNASGSTSTKTTTSTTPAPTASDPNPAPIPGPTTSTSSPVVPASSQPQNPFVPPTVPIPPVNPVPPGVIQLPIPTIDNTSGTCPAPIVLNLGLPGLETLTWDLTPWCTLATNLRPLVLTAAGLAAAFLLVR